MRHRPRKILVEILHLLDLVIFTAQLLVLRVLRIIPISWCDLLAFTAPESIARGLTYRSYARQSRQYRTMAEPFGWEADIFDYNFPSPPGKVLIGAAGAGREAELLLKRGYEVACFEPVAEMASEMEKRLSAGGILDKRVLVILQCSYEELLSEDSQAGGEGRRIVEELGPYDICIFGWGSLSHIRNDDDRRRMISFFRKWCPSGPILLSWIPTSERSLMRARVRRMLSKLTGKNRDLFYRWNAGFYEALSCHEIMRLAQSVGERPSVLSAQPYGHALLLPHLPAKNDRAATPEGTELRSVRNRPISACSN